MSQAGPKKNGAMFKALQEIEKELESTGSLSKKLKMRIRMCQESLKKFPLDLPTPKHAKILEGFNQDVIDMLQKHMKKSKQRMPLSPIANTSSIGPGPSGTAEAPVTIDDDSEDDGDQSNTALSQEEQDFELAMKLSQEWEQEAAQDQEDQEQQDLKLAQALSQDVHHAEEDLDHEEPDDPTMDDFDLAMKLNAENFATYTDPKPKDAMRKRSKSCELPSFDLNASYLDDLRKRQAPTVNDTFESDKDSDSTISPVKMSFSQPSTQAASKNVFSQDPIFAKFDQGVSNKIHDISDSDSDDNDVKATIVAPPRATHSISTSDSDDNEEPRPVAKPPTKRSKPGKKQGKCARGSFLIDLQDLPSWASSNVKAPCSNPCDATAAMAKLWAGDFDVILLVDSMEVTGGFTGGKKGTKDLAMKELKSRGVPFETRRLVVGDFGWMAKPRPSSAFQKELMLPYIVERKRLDDLKSSIIDKRYHEQKARLAQSGMHRIIYLIEGYSKHKKYWSKDSTLKAVHTATVSSALTESFSVHMTENVTESVKYLAHLTEQLREKYAKLSLDVCDLDALPSHSSSKWESTLLTFEDFSKNSKKTKSLSQSDLFVRMLAQQRSVTPSMATGIVAKYPTLASLLDAYDQCQSEAERESLLIGIKYEGGTKSVSLRISKILSWLYTDKQLK